MAKEYIAKSFKGLKRQTNKDSFQLLESKDYYLFILYDGVSSAKGAKQAIEVVTKFVQKNHSRFLRESYNLAKLMFEANQFLINQNIEDPFTTYSSVYISKQSNEFIISSLGDSRIYLITEKFKEQVTEDHSYSRNTLTKFLGQEELSENEFFQQRLFDESYKILLCTDGFYSLMEERLLEFFKAINFPEFSKVGKKLDKLLLHHNTDDATYILIKDV